MIRLAKQYGWYGDRKVTALLRMEGWRVNHKKVERLWGDDVLIGTDVSGFDIVNDHLCGGAGQDFLSLGRDGQTFYTGANRAYFKNLDIYGADADFIVLNGLSGTYTFVDLGTDLEIRQATDGNVIATVETAETGERTSRAGRGRGSRPLA